MDFSTIFQLRTKKLWWVDVIFYFAVSLLIAAVLCYGIFLLKNSMQKEDIRKETEALQTVGTEQQKGYEKDVIDYQRKISDFTSLFKNYQFASNVFAFMETVTLPNIWFKQFSLDKGSNAVQLVGESDDMDSFSRQVAYFERDKYVKSLGSLNSSVGDSARIQFNLNLDLDKSIFTYITDAEKAASEAAKEEEAGSETTEGQQADETAQTGDETAVAEEELSSEKLITSFNFPLTPPVVGTLDQTNHEVVLNVPFGTDVKTLAPEITLSNEATVSPLTATPQDFTVPAIYKVTAQDGSTQDYKITVNILPEPVKEKPAGLNIWIIIGLTAVVIAIIAVIIFFVWKKMKDKKLKMSQNV